MTGYGTYAASVRLGHGVRRRRSFKTLAEAKAWVVAGGETGAVPNQGLIEDAIRARGNLPDAVTLEEAARYWASSHKGAELVALGDAADRYLSDVRPLLRCRTYTSYRQVLTDLCSALGEDRVVADLCPDDLERSLAGRSPVSRNNRIRAFSTFFNWCRDRSLVRENPATALRRARIPRKVPGVLSVSEASRLLEVAAGGWPDVVSYYALGLFGGLRPEEALRVRPSVVRNGYLVLDGSITKTADTRNVKVRPNLAAWLDAYPIPPRGFSAKRVKAARAAYGRMPPDSARHSYATYAYELTGDAARVAASMGHCGTEVFFKHYRALAEPGSGEQYFSIMPPA